MKVVRSQSVTALSGQLRRLEICVGDATEVSSTERVDLLALSCFRNSYIPTRGTIVQALSSRGVVVGDLARQAVRDHREKWQCWISGSLPQAARFRRLICFEHEPASREQFIDPASVVGNIFRAVTDFVQETATRELTIFRLPLLSTGDQAADKRLMLGALLHAAYAHLRGCLPVQRVQIVLHDKLPELHSLLLDAGQILEQTQAEWATAKLVDPPSFDFLVSYRRNDRDDLADLIRRIRAREPKIKIFLDERSLEKGICWKPEIICGLHNSRRALCLITDSYVESPECIDEFHIALCLSRARKNFLRPLLRLKARSIDSLPRTISRVNLIDAVSPPRNIESVITDVLS
jgi:hypothetical protein